MKIVYSNCCGVDVHKDQITITHLCYDKRDKPVYETKRFSTMYDDLMNFAKYLQSKQCVNVCMESTGKYYIPVFRALESYGIRAVVAHPKYVKAIKGQKTDKKDSKWIAELFSHGLVRPSYIPSQSVVDLRDLTRYQTKLNYMASGEKNRIQNSMTMSGIMLQNVVSDAFGKAATAILKYKLANNNAVNLDFSEFMHGRMKATSDDVNRSMKGSFSSEQSIKANLALDHLGYISRVLEQLEIAIDLLCEPFERQIALLCTIPGVTRYSAIRIVAETGGDMSVFESSKHLVSWLGLCPQCNESNKKRKSTHISKAGSNIKPILIQVALGAIRSKEHKFFAYKYKQLFKRRGKMRALIALARMIMVSVYYMLSKNEVFNADLYNAYHQQQAAPFRQNIISKVVAHLAAQGFVCINTETGQALTLPSG